MAFCKNCGAFLAEGDTFCASCGTQNEVATSNAQPASGGLKNLFAKILDTKDYSNSFHPTDVQNNKVLALFSYIGLLFLIPLFAAKDSKYARFHVNQGIIFCIACVATNVAYGILFGMTWLFGAIHISLGILVGMACGIIALAIQAVTVGYTVIGIINAVSGKAKELPFIGKFRILK